MNDPPTRWRIASVGFSPAAAISSAVAKISSCVTLLSAIADRCAATVCGATGSAPPAACLLVESAVDALSAALLPAPGLPPACLIASTAGTARHLPRWLDRFPGSRLLCGYDADPAGDQAARALLRQHPALRRLRPLRAKDWNDLLRSPAPR